MFRIAVVVLTASVAFAVRAECYVRSAMTSRTSTNITAIADAHPLVVPISSTQNKCIVTFRAQVNGEWITAEGESVGPKSLSESALCRNATDQGRTQILSRADGAKIVMEQNMVCTDQPATEVRSVKIGDTVRESEVRPHQNFPKKFKYRGTECRWFIEPEVRNGDLLQRQGIICRVTSNDWNVVDKW